MLQAPFSRLPLFLECSLPAWYNLLTFFILLGRFFTFPSPVYAWYMYSIGVYAPKLGPGLAAQSCLGGKACLCLAGEPLTLHPDLWTDLLAWSWTCRVTTDLSGNLDSCLPPAAVPGSVLLPLVVSVGWGPGGRGPALLALLSCLTPGSPSFGEQPAVGASWQSFGRLTDNCFTDLVNSKHEKSWPAFAELSFHPYLAGDGANFLQMYVSL